MDEVTLHFLRHAALRLIESLSAQARAEDWSEAYYRQKVVEEMKKIVGGVGNGHNVSIL